METNSKRSEAVSFRLFDDELDRLDQIVKRAKSRNRSVDRSKIIRELIGFDVRVFITDEDLQILRGEIPVPAQAKEPPTLFLHSDGTGMAPKGKHSRAVKKDIEDIRADAQERIRQKKAAGIKPKN